VSEEPRTVSAPPDPWPPPGMTDLGTDGLGNRFALGPAHHHRFEIGPETNKTIARGDAHKITIYNRGGSKNTQVIRLHEAELRLLHETTGKYLEAL
jgi:hypothetical protein